MKTKTVRANNNSPKNGESQFAPSTTRYNKIKESLAVASQLIITAPLKLPPKIVAVAKYLALALGVLEAVEGGVKKGDKDEDDET